MNHLAQSEGINNVWSLLQINQLPVNFSDPLIHQYPAMKIGVLSAVEFYIELLANKVMKLIDDCPSITEWVLTAPPLIKAPAAANLLSWRLHDHLRSRISKRVTLSAVTLQFIGDSEQIVDEKDFKLRYEYSRNSLDERIKERSRLKDDIGHRGDDFFNKGIIVVNDIKVTGTQQEHMKNSFDKVNPAALNWLYVVEVDKTLGVEHPEVEHQINCSRLNTLEEFIDVLKSDDHHFTARCISRVFNYNLDQFDHLLNQLGDRKKRELYELAAGEGRFSGAFFRDKFSRLKQQAS